MPRGSDGMVEIYVGTTQGARSKIGNVPVVAMVDEVVGIAPAAHGGVPPSKIPWLSAIRWPIESRMARTLEVRWVSRAWENCRAGLMAMITTPAKIAMMPMTTKSSMRVKPLWALFIAKPFGEYLRRRTGLVYHIVQKRRVPACR